MSGKTGKAMGLVVHPLTLERWKDLEKLFGTNGACGGCWCMHWRTTPAEFQQNKGEGNRRALRKLAGGTPSPGLIGYVEGVPVAWIALGPRADYPRLARSRVLAPVDDKPVWSVTCFFIARGWRGRGLSVRMLEEAARYAAAQGATLLEGYPHASKKAPMPPPFVWCGLESAFLKAGFSEVARRSPGRPMMRRRLRRAR